MHTIRYKRTRRRRIPNIFWYVIIGMFGIISLFASPGHTVVYGQLYPTPTPIPACSGYCLTSCLFGQNPDPGGACSGGNICCMPAPTPTGGTVNCAYNNGCDSCGPGETWVSNLRCPAGTDCANQSQLVFCSAISAGCIPVAPPECSQTCHPFFCQPICGLGGCPGGCGSIDDCGGVDCTSCPSGVPATPTPVPTSPPPPSGGPTPTPIPPGIARARAKIIPASATTCGDVAGSTDYLGENIGLAPGGGYQFASGGSYASWSVNPGTYTIADVPPAGYALKIACFTGVNPGSAGTGIAANILGDQTVTWELGYTLGTSWVQTAEGDVYGQSAIRSYIPVTALTPYFSVNGAAGTPGIVTYGGQYDFESSYPDQGTAKVSQTGWLARETYPQNDFYQVMYHRFGSPIATDNALFSDLTEVTKPPGRSTPYYLLGDMETSGNWSIPDGETIVFLVNGNLTIHGTINISGTGSGFIAFIVNGTITIDPTVGGLYSSSTPVVEGIYITSPAGVFQTGSSSVPGKERFVGKGMFIAGSFFLQRDLESVAQNQNVSSELFLYNPQLLLTMPDKMKDLPISWQEVAP